MFVVENSIDGTVVPSLAGKAIAHGYREALCGFIEVNFPGQFYAYSNRIDINWFDVVRDYQETTGTALDWSIRSLGALHIGRSQDNTQVGHIGREMYGRALSHLIRSLNNPALATTDDTLGAAILLGVFEMVCSSGQKSWMIHSRGISYLFQARGAQAHAHGLGRTFLLSFRGFLVYDALIRGERCFLEDKEWKSIIPDMINEDRRRGKASRLGELIEFSFHEVARCPGFLAATRTLVGSAQRADTERECLIASISDCQRTLLEYHYEGIAAMKASQQPNSNEGWHFFGPIPNRVQVSLGEFSLEGMSSAIALLQQLLVILSSDGLRRGTSAFGSGNQQCQIQWENVRYPLTIKSNKTESSSDKVSISKEDNATPYTWFDRVSMMMGMVMNE